MALIPITEKKHGDTIYVRTATDSYTQFIIQDTTGEGVKIVARYSVANKAFDPDNTNSFSASSSNSNNIGYYLNNDYFNTLHEETKNMLVDAKWYTGYSVDGSINPTNEKTRSVTAKVGLLTQSEFGSNKGNTLYGGKIPLISSSEWTITPYGNSSSQAVMIARPNGSVVADAYNPDNAKTTKGVRPAMVLKSSTLIDTTNNRLVPNQLPVITPTITPSGTYTTKPSFNYTVSDADGHAMTITESIDGIVFNTRTAVASGTQLTFTPTDLAWLRTRIKQTVNITIKADDGNGGVTTVNYPITRTTPAIDLQLKTPFETDVAARRLLLQLEGNIPNDAIVSVQACNNAFDTTPTWENATNLVLSGFPYPFSNTTKTATKWGVSFKVRIERGSSTQPIYIDGIGGAFD